MGSQSECTKVAQRTIALLESEGADWIVIPSGSCAAMFHHYSHLFQDMEWRTRATRIINQTAELTSFLVDVLRVTDVHARFNGRITWHDACHGLHDLGIETEPRALLQHVAGLEVVEMEHGHACCGFGGAFSVTYPNVSTAIVDRKLDEIEAHQVDAVVSGDVGCLMQIGNRLRKRGSTVQTMHIAELLANAS